MRDYFPSEVAAWVNDPNVVMRLLRHTNLNTTPRYLRTVKGRMQEAVNGLGSLVANLVANYRLKRRKTTFPKIVNRNQIQLVKKGKRYLFSQGRMVAVVGVEPTTPRI